MCLSGLVRAEEGVGVVRQSHPPGAVDRWDRTLWLCRFASGMEPDLTRSVVSRWGGNGSTVHSETTQWHARHAEDVAPDGARQAAKSGPGCCVPGRGRCGCWGMVCRPSHPARPETESIRTRKLCGPEGTRTVPVVPGEPAWCPSLRVPMLVTLIGCQGPEVVEIEEARTIW